MGDHMVYGHQSPSSEASQLLATFWPRVMNEVRTKPLQVQKSGSKKDEPIQELPLARIKKIMKQDGEVKMISAEAPILFSKAAEIFISELSLRAWIHTEDNKRRTLQRNDIAMAITKYDQFDFLIDIVPRDELKPAKRQEETIRQTSNIMAPEQIQYYVQLAQLQQQAGVNTGVVAGNTGGSTSSNAVTAAPASSATPANQLTQLPAGAHIIQQANGQMVILQPQHLTAGQQLVQIQTSDQVQQGNANQVQVQQQQQIQQQQQQQQQQQAQSQQQQAATTTTTHAQVLQAGGQQIQIQSGSQMQYIRIPQSTLQQLQQQQQQQQSQGEQQTSSNSPSSALAAHVLQLQQLQAINQQRQQQQQQGQDSQQNQEEQSAAQQQQQQQQQQHRIYQSMQGNTSQQTVYVMSHAGNGNSEQETQQSQG